jgi:hemolysin activation/secretion protein
MMMPAGDQPASPARECPSPPPRSATASKITRMVNTLARDTRLSDPNLEASHGVLRLETGVVYDSRDNELSQSRGQLHRLKLRVSPRIGDAMPYGYQQINVTTRFYLTVVPRYMILAFRSVFDLQLGDVPVYELARYEDTSAIGGGGGVRGVPAYRFYGKVKAFGNVELRSETFKFSAYGKPIILGFAAFFDAGRLWSDLTQDQPQMDGVGLGLHFGLGGGIRLQQGRSFLVRADVAWSPDARPVGAYLQANHTF